MMRANLLLGIGILLATAQAGVAAPSAQDVSCKSVESGSKDTGLRIRGYLRTVAAGNEDSDQMGASEVVGKLRIRRGRADPFIVEVKGQQIERDANAESIRFATLTTNSRTIREIFMGFGKSGSKSHIEFSPASVVKLMCAARPR